jgi:hypothetical protein
MLADQRPGQAEQGVGDHRLGPLLGVGEVHTGCRCAPHRVLPWPWRGPIEAEGDQEVRTSTGPSAPRGPACRASRRRRVLNLDPTPTKRSILRVRSTKVTAPLLLVPQAVRLALAWAIRRSP